MPGPENDSLAAMLAADEEKLEPEPKEPDADAPDPETPEVNDDPPEDDGEPEPNENDEADDDAQSIREYAKELLGDDAKDWLSTFKDDDALLKSALEAVKLVGRKNEDAEVGRFLRDQGMTAREVAELLASRDKDTAPKGGSQDDDWDDSWVQLDDKLNWVPTPEAPKDIADRVRRRQALFAKAAMNPSKLAELIRPYLAKDIEEKADAVRKETLAKQRHDANVSALDKWRDSKRNILYADDSLDAMSPLGSAVEKYLQAGRHPKYGILDRSDAWDAQAETALEWARLDATPKREKRVVPNKAKHQTEPAKRETQKLTDEEFMEKYPSSSLYALVHYRETGELPASGGK